MLLSWQRSEALVGACAGNASFHLSSRSAKVVHVGEKITQLHRTTARRRPGRRRESQASVGHHCQQHRLRRQLSVTVRCGEGLAIEEPGIDQFVRALLLGWFASQAGSQYAANCLVETISEMYREGISIEETNMSLSMAGLQSGGTLLAPIELDTLKAWVALVTLTLQTIAVPLNSKGRQRQQQGGPIRQGGGSATGLGMQRFVRQIIDLYQGGMDSRRLLLQQSMAEAPKEDGAPRGQVSPSVRAMQQNTRLIILALEVARESGLPLGLDLRSYDYTADDGGGDSPASPVEQGSKDADAIIDSVGYVQAFMAPSGGQAPLRWSAVRLLISFMGAVLGSQYAVSAFVEEAYSSYRAGHAAGELYAQLSPQEFLQTGGILVSAGLPMVNEELFRRWLSIAFMALAQLAVPRPMEAALQPPGWAFAGGDAVEANSLAEFVAGALRRNAQAAEPPSQTLEAVMEAAASAEAAGQVQAPAWSSADAIRVRLEDPALGATSGSVQVLAQQLDLVRLVRDRAARELGSAAEDAAVL